MFFFCCFLFADGSVTLLVPQHVQAGHGAHGDHLCRSPASQAHLLHSQHHHPCRHAVVTQRAGLHTPSRLRGEDGTSGHRVAVLHSLSGYHLRQHAQNLR
jgi:hypothetical protein